MKKLILVVVIAIFAGAVAGWVLHRPQDTDPPPAPQAQARAADPTPDEAIMGRVVLKTKAVRDMGLGVTVLRGARHAPQSRTYAVVLPTQSLANLSAAYVTDRKDVVMARANLLVAQSEYKRQALLYRENQNTSLKALQAERGTMESSRAQTNAAQMQLRIDALNAEQQWGPVVGQWVVTRQKELNQILSQKEWLVEVTFAANEPNPAPRFVRLIAPSGLDVTGRYVSAFPQTNPVIQGLNFLYAIPARPGFAPGLNLVAEIPNGPEQSGVVIPTAAVVWAQGQAWAYKETSPGNFERLAVPTDEPVTDGWFVTRGFAPGNRIVTRAAEELFSAETLNATASQGD